MDYDEFAKKVSFGFTMLLMTESAGMDAEMVGNLTDYVLAPLQSRDENGPLSLREQIAFAVMVGATAERCKLLRKKENE